MSDHNAPSAGRFSSRGMLQTMLEQNQQQLQLSHGLEAHLGTMLDESTQLSQQLAAALQEYRESRSSKKRCVSTSPLGCCFQPPLKLAKAPEPKPGSTTPPASSAMGAGKGLDASIAGLRPQLMTAVRHPASDDPPDNSGARRRHNDAGASETRDNTNHAPVSLCDKQRNRDAELVGASAAGVRISSGGGGNGVRRDSGSSSSGGVPAHAQALLLPHLSQPPLPTAARGKLLNSDVIGSATETRGLHAKGPIPSAAAAATTAAAARLRPRSSRHNSTLAGGSLQQQLQQQQQPMLLRDRIRRQAHRHFDGGVLVASGSHLEIASQQPAAAAVAAALRACGKADVGFASPVAAAAAGITNTAPQLEMEYAAGNSRDGSGGSRSSNSSSFGALAQLGSRNSSSPHFPSSPTTGGPSSPGTLLRTQSSHEQLPPSPPISSSLRPLAAPAARNGACALATAPQVVSAGLPIAAAAAPPLRLLLPPALPPLAPNNAGISRNTFDGGVGIRLLWPQQQHPQQATASVGGTAEAGVPFTQQQWRPCAQQAQRQQQPVAAAAHDGGGHVVAAAVSPVGGGAAAAGANYARTSSEQLDSINFDSVLWQLDENELDAILFK